ncbi:OmpA family protein [Winogradskyella sp.]|uniref:OmpA family protein n=1 Tax=Winogradskyella sp. TaxID=1883156 RepID=UPI00235667F7|nr:OmpA family protein [Winogradskyella sp.]
MTTASDNEKVNTVDLMLEPLIIDNQIVINPIFFDFDKWNIRTDAQYELENIVDVMRKHPKMVIKIESHTDSRGGDRYNMKLSDRRAKSTRDYIISRGIDADRIESAIGYGESQLLNKCTNRVKCTEEEHQLNRRSYFYIVKE